MSALSKLNVATKPFRVRRRSHRDNRLGIDFAGPEEPVDPVRAVYAADAAVNLTDANLMATSLGESHPIEDRRLVQQRCCLLTI